MVALIYVNSQDMKKWFFQKWDVDPPFMTQLPLSSLGI